MLLRTEGKAVTEMQVSVTIIHLHAMSALFAPAAEGTFRFAMAVLEGAGRLPPGLQQAAVAKLVAYLRREAAALENTDPLRLSSAEMEAILSVVDEDWAVAEEQRGRLSSVLRKLVPKSVEQVEEQASAAFAASLQVHRTSC